ncbi:hypothetical protein [Burkholderia sp. BCC1630]|uniref:hypothetical protein n=1 Tax=Burkholderia sp. BCC1630 TaxID=2676304 RepID=UPI00158D122E|nr:hypothetical protein [Burkholderia sp. BCC1630]
MEPLWEYRWEYVDPYYGVIECKFWMTDWEAERWHGYGNEGTRRLEETRRDRNLQPKSTEQALAHASAPMADDPLPEFASPDVGTLRRWWKNPELVDGADVRRMVLEVIALRRLLNASVKVAAESREG